MININGTISVDNFIESALYDKNYGYYAKKNPFGKKGDFITAPIISPLFSEIILIWVISYWINLGKPKKFSFVELGPGNGAFCKTFCRTLKKFPEFERSIKIYLLEKSEKLIKIQKNIIKDKNVIWVKNLGQIKDGPILFFGNEFFDSVPIKQFEVKKSNICEKFIHFEKNRFKKFIFKKVPKKTTKILKELGLFRKKGIIEYPKKGLQILELITKKINKLNGGILLIDYGFIKAQGKDTLQSLKSHKKNVFYKNIGDADITYLVNFQLLNKFFFSRKFFLNKIVSQNFFLRKLGILERAEILSKNLSFKEKSDLYYRLERLLSKKKMGSLFKVIFAANSKGKFNLGFK
jgi:NADH dehydrogenase [ubiquinone] 1 alpha subcomplex assembly factor 7